MGVKEFLSSDVLRDCVCKAVGPFLGMDVPLFEKCLAVSKVVYDSTKEACGEFGVRMYLVAGSWRGLATREFSLKIERSHVFRDHAHNWLLITDADVFVHTIMDDTPEPPNNNPGPRQERSAYFDATACQFTGQPWSFEGCFGSVVEGSLVQERVWTIK